MGGRLSVIAFVCRAGTVEERYLPADGRTVLRMCGADRGGKVFDRSRPTKTSIFICVNLRNLWIKLSF